MNELPGWAAAAAALARARAFVRALAHRGRAEREMREEFEHHLAARTDDLVREGLAPDEARRQAQREFGHAGTYRTEAREAMGLASFAQVRFSWLDIKLGLRMLPKHPVLNLAAIFALAVGIPVGLAPSHLARALEAPLPGDADDRIRAIRHWDPLSSAVAPTWEGDFTHWAGTLTSFSSLGAFRTSDYSVASAGSAAVPAPGAQLSRTVFPMLAARPLLGRVLEERDFDAGAPEVVVIGHALWSSHFGRDAAILGRAIRIGRELHTVVGVMPEGFTFPANELLWLPLRSASVGGEEVRATVQVLGRLHDGVSEDAAQSELAMHGRPALAGLASAGEMEERARLRAEVVPFGLLFLGLPAGGLASQVEFRFVQALMLALLLVASGNVAMLMFARTATRLREIAIRSALGASRMRIVSQIFVETLLLAVIAAGAGVLAADWVLRHVNVAAIAGAPALPYWLSLGLTPRTVLSALGLAALSATIAGALPAIIITGRAIAQGMGGGARVRFGRLTGALVVADIAVAVAAVAMAFAVSGHATAMQRSDRVAGIVAAEYLAVELRRPEAADVSDAVASDTGAVAEALRRASDQVRGLVATLEREPGVRRVAVGNVLPRMEHPSRPFEVDGAAGSTAARRRWTRVAQVDPEFFGALGAPVLHGRDFARTDLEGDARIAIVNTAFVERNLGGGDAIGRRVRFPAHHGRGEAVWHEIVGVVGHLGVSLTNAERGEAVYLPAAPGSIEPLRLAVHTMQAPAALAGRVRALVASVDPDFVVTRTTPLVEVRQGDWYLVMGVAAGLVALAAVLVALATSGLYAMLALSVTERTREIGIRAALGAPRGKLLLTILRRPLVQIGLGAVIGLPFAVQFLLELSGVDERAASPALAIVGALGLAMGIVCLVGVSSCLVPMRRVLAVDASEAMRAEG